MASSGARRRAELGQTEQRRPQGELTQAYVGAGAGRQGAADRADRQHDVEQPVHRSRAVEGVLGHAGEHDREVEAQGADHADESDRPTDVRPGSDVAQSLAQLAGLTVRRRCGQQLARPDPAQRDDRHQVAAGSWRRTPSRCRRC